MFVLLSVFCQVVASLRLRKNLALRLRKKLAFVIGIIVFISEDRDPEKVHIELTKAYMSECAKFELDW